MRTRRLRMRKRREAIDGAQSYIPSSAYPAIHFHICFTELLRHTKKASRTGGPLAPHYPQGRALWCTILRLAASLCTLGHPQLLPPSPPSRTHMFSSGCKRSGRSRG